jgi:hypothetical protein
MDRKQPMVFVVPVVLAASMTDIIQKYLRGDAKAAMVRVTIEVDPPADNEAHLEQASPDQILLREIGECLDALRRKHSGISRDAMADALGMARSNLSRLAHGQLRVARKVVPHLSRECHKLLQLGVQSTDTDYIRLRSLLGAKKQ